MIDERETSEGAHFGEVLGDPAERRFFERFDTHLLVDVASGDTFLFAYITNISEMGIFLRSESPLPVGTELRLRFPGEPLFELAGMVVWVNPIRHDRDNPNPGMGVRFAGLTLLQREHVVELVHTVAYLRDDKSNAD